MRQGGGSRKKYEPHDLHPTRSRPDTVADRRNPYITCGFDDPEDDDEYDPDYAIGASSPTPAAAHYADTLDADGKSMHHPGDQRKKGRP